MGAIRCSAAGVRVPALMILLGAVWALPRAFSAESGVPDRVTTVELELWSQCGNEKGQWPGKKCSPDSTCVRLDRWYMQCKPLPSKASIVLQPWDACGAAVNQQAVCPPGYTCKQVDQWYSQCQPGTMEVRQEPSKAAPAQNFQARSLSPSKLSTSAQSAVTTADATPAAVWSQCGGSGHCGTNTPCADTAWTTVTCPSGSICTRDNQWWWQCKPTMTSQTSLTGSAGSNMQASTLTLWAQCGGKGSDCNRGDDAGRPCKDAVWPAAAASCPTGSSCKRVDAWFWQCQPRTAQGRNDNAQQRSQEGSILITGTAADIASTNAPKPSAGKETAKGSAAAARDVASGSTDASNAAAATTTQQQSPPVKQILQRNAGHNTSATAAGLAGAVTRNTSNVTAAAAAPAKASPDGTSRMKQPNAIGANSTATSQQTRATGNRNVNGTKLPTTTAALHTVTRENGGGRAEINSTLAAAAVSGSNTTRGAAAAADGNTTRPAAGGDAVLPTAQITFADYSPQSFQSSGAAAATLDALAAITELPTQQISATYGAGGNVATTGTRKMLQQGSSTTATYTFPNQEAVKLLQTAANKDNPTGSSNSSSSSSNSSSNSTNSSNNDSPSLLTAIDQSFAAAALLPPRITAVMINGQQQQLPEQPRNASAAAAVAPTPATVYGGHDVNTSIGGLLAGVLGSVLGLLGLVLLVLWILASKGYVLPCFRRHQQPATSEDGNNNDNNKSNNLASSSGKDSLGSNMEQSKSADYGPHKGDKYWKGPGPWDHTDTYGGKDTGRYKDQQHKNHQQSFNSDLTNSLNQHMSSTSSFEVADSAVEPAAGLEVDVAGYTDPAAAAAEALSAAAAAEAPSAAAAAPAPALRSYPLRGWTSLDGRNTATAAAAAVPWDTPTASEAETAASLTSSALLAAAAAMMGNTKQDRQLRQCKSLDSTADATAPAGAAAPWDTAAAAAVGSTMAAAARTSGTFQRRLQRWRSIESTGTGSVAAAEWDSPPESPAAAAAAAAAVAAEVPAAAVMPLRPPVHWKSIDSAGATIATVPWDSPPDSPAAAAAAAPAAADATAAAAISSSPQPDDIDSNGNSKPNLHHDAATAAQSASAATAAAAAAADADHSAFATAAAAGGVWPKWLSGLLSSSSNNQQLPQQHNGALLRSITSVPVRDAKHGALTVPAYGDVGLLRSTYSNKYNTTEALTTITTATTTVTAQPSDTSIKPTACRTTPEAAAEHASRYESSIAAPRSMKLAAAAAAADVEPASPANSTAAVSTATSGSSCSAQAGMHVYSMSAEHVQRSPAARRLIL